MEVRVSYDMDRQSQMDAMIEKNVRPSDFSGMGMGCRDHGWVCKSEIEAQQIVRGLKALGLNPEIRN